ncbi:DUF4188 domain-containing protein [Paenibacillus sp.]|uniref:DUF4188 domain-containing protein n=1 Tax=Paenibacillus sp. TaxID=58172 RepID=UPI00281223A9|nr:DUF4188 domain-containing protein [Paenibacillus sp.]
MANVQAGRHTAAHEGELVVFVIGMQVNSWWAIHRWWPVAMAMGPMISELYRNKELGFLDAQFLLSPRGPVTIQYWRSYEDLENYARHGAKHLKAWKDYNRKAAAGSKHVGVFHETYMVDAGKYESVYVNTPKFGLGRASGLVPATGRRETARRRLGGDNEPAVAE